MNNRQCEWGGGPPWRKDDWRTHGSAGRVRFFRRLAVAAFLLFLLGVSGVVALVWLALNSLGILTTPLQGGITMVLIAGLLIGAALMVVGRAMQRVAMPLRRVMEAADRVADGDYSVRVDEHGPPPIRGLARAFNTMTERLGKHDEQRRNMMADIAHELRTPLTIIQGKLEGLVDGVYPSDDANLNELLEEANLLSRLIEDLRTLALSEAGALQLEKEPTDLSELTGDVVQAFQAEASERQIELKLNAPSALPYPDIDPMRIRQVLNNLLSNSLQHTPSGGTVEVSVAQPESQTLSVQVRDTGSGMTEEQLRSVFDRFQKGASSHGAGLGLTIARNLVLAHGGEMRAFSEPGSGTTIRFTLKKAA